MVSPSRTRTVVVDEAGYSGWQSTRTPASIIGRCIAPYTATFSANWALPGSMDGPLGE